MTALNAKVMFSWIKCSFQVRIQIWLQNLIIDYATDLKYEWIRIYNTELYITQFARTEHE
jgi:hypothetical protein